MSRIDIRKGTMADIDAIMSVYDTACRYMRLTGNTSQWINGYPSRELVCVDIALGHNYVGEDADGEIVMVFAFIIGADESYAVIEDGEWLDDRPYGTIHRIGSTGKHSGMLKACVDYCFMRIDNLRLDTHADNRPMQSVVERLGFLRCGTIRCIDGSPRVAYQKSLKR